MLTNDNTVLELGDRVRIVARRGDMDRIARFMGDSYRALSEIDVLTFSLGITAGLLIGMIPIPLPGGIVFMLGFAGGPLLVALILAMGRTGRGRSLPQRQPHTVAACHVPGTLSTRWLRIRLDQPGRRPLPFNIGPSSRP
jgi:hypothetical protein